MCHRDADAVESRFRLIEYLQFLLILDMMVGNPVAANNITETCERVFTPLLRQSISLWSEDCSVDGSNRIHTSIGVLRKRLEIIASEASYLGYSRVLQICKAAKASIDAAQSKGLEWDGSTASEGRALAWNRAWQLIVNAVTEPGSLTSAETSVAIRGLQQAFQLSESQIKEAIALRSVTRNGEYDEQSTNADESSRVDKPRAEDHVHHDTNVYRRDTIGALDHCTQEESWIVSQLANVAEDIATGVSAHRPAHRLMNVLRGHRFFQHVDRVCLAGRVPGANQLVIVDSAVSERSVRNELLKGYSCFVNPNGSLFSMQPSTVRVFGECSKVLESFHQQNKPAQRSIALIAEQGLRSGLCMAIGRGTTIQGFLFLNSMESGLFTDVTPRYAPLLSLFGLVGTISLDAAGFHGVSENNPWAVSPNVPNHSVHFVASELEGWLRSHLNYWMGRDVRIDLQVNEQIGDFLYLPRVIVQTVSDSLMRMVWNEHLFDHPLRIVIERNVEEVSIAIEHGSNLDALPNVERIQALVDSMNQKLLKQPLRFSLDSQFVKITFPFEPTIIGTGGQLYSIVH